MSKNSFVDPEQFSKDIEIGLDLDNAFRQQAALFAYYAGKAYAAQAHADGKKQVVSLRRAQIAKQIRDRLADEGKKGTEAAIEQEIEVNPDYARARREHNEAQGVADYAKVCLEGLKQRRDMLIQLGANAREESKGDMGMRSSVPHSISAYTRSIAREGNADADGSGEV